MAQFIADIQSYATGASLPAEWVNRISAQPHTAGVSDGTAYGEQFLYITSNSSDGSRVYSYTPLDGAQDVEILVKFSIGSSTSSTNGRNGIGYTRYMGTSEATTKGMAVTFTPASSVKSLMVNEDSVTTAVDYSNYDWSLNTKYWMRQRINGTSWYMKIWPAGTSEPSSWTKSGSYAWPTIATPYSGVGHFRGDNTLRVFFFSGATNGDIAPTTLLSKQITGGARIATTAIPANTPIVGFGGGWGASAGFGRAYGEALLPGVTVTDRTQIGSARIARTESRTQAGNARIRQTVTRNQTGNARIRVTVSRNQTANSRIQTTSQRTQTGVSRVLRIESRPQLGSALLESATVSTDQAQLGNARLAAIYSRTQSGNARISNVVSRAQLGNARIRQTVTRDQQGVSRIAAQYARTQAGNASVSKDGLRLISGTSRLTRVELRVIQGISRISSQVTRALPGNVRISTSMLRGQTGVAAILRQPAMQQTAHALIAKEVLRAQPAGALIIRIYDNSKPRTGVINSSPFTGIYSATSRSSVSLIRPRTSSDSPRPKIGIIRDNNRGVQ